jgi:hypothetical protein
MLAALFESCGQMVGDSLSDGWLDAEREQKRRGVVAVRTYCQHQATDSQHVILEGDMEGQLQTQK